jgi:PIN domain nuclease of toxin-antitoxin system
VATVAYLDTHVAAWLFAGDVDRLSAAARATIQNDDLLVSPAVVLELQYLYETKRVTDAAESVIEDLRHRLSVRECDLPFSDVTRRALRLSWTRDPFDRLIVAQAALRDAKLVTKDRALRKRYAASVW